MRNVSRMLWTIVSYLFVSVVMMTLLAFWIEPFDGPWFSYIRGILIVMLLNIIGAMVTEYLAKRKH